MDKSNSYNSLKRPFAARLIACLAIAWLASSASAKAGALENYINKPDTNYTWKKLDQKEDEGFAIAHLDLVSQQWRDGVWRTTCRW